ncbi:MAG: phosphatase PAP2 family protein [Thermoplasmatota archaeon]
MRRAALGLAGVVGFLAIAADEVSGGLLTRLDRLLDGRLTTWQAAWPVLHGIGNVLSLPGYGPVVAVVVAVAALLLWPRARRLAVLVVAAGLVAWALVSVLKPAFHRPLPPFLAQTDAGGFSFPSGHTLAATGGLGGVAAAATAHPWLAPRGRLRGWLWGAWIALAFVTGVGLVLAQNHWLSDVLASWCLGAAIVAALLLLRDRPTVDATR